MKNPVLKKIVVWMPVLSLALGSTTALADLFVDPTKPANYIGEAGETNPLALTATFIYPTHQLAIINGTLLKVGDHYGQFTITSITPYSVELKGPQNTREELFLVT